MYATLVRTYVICRSAFSLVARKEWKQIIQITKAIWPTKMPVAKVSTVLLVLLAIFARTRATIPRFCKESSTCEEKDGERCGKNFKGFGFVAFDEEKTDTFLFYDVGGIKYGACIKPTSNDPTIEQPTTGQTKATANETTMTAQMTNKPIKPRKKPVETPKKGQSVINRLLALWTHVYAQTDCIHHVFSPDSPYEPPAEQYMGAFVVCGLALFVIFLIMVCGVTCGRKSDDDDKENAKAHQMAKKIHQMQQKQGCCYTNVDCLLEYYF